MKEMSEKQHNICDTIYHHSIFPDLLVSRFFPDEVCENTQKALKSCLCVCFGIPSKGCVKYLYIEKELIPAVWMVFLIFLITTIF